MAWKIAWQNSLKSGVVKKKSGFVNLIPPWNKICKHVVLRNCFKHIQHWKPLVLYKNVKFKTILDLKLNVLQFKLSKVYTWLNLDNKDIRYA